MVTDSSSAIAGTAIAAAIVIAAITIAITFLLIFHSPFPYCVFCKCLTVRQRYTGVGKKMRELRAGSDLLYKKKTASDQIILI